MAVSKRIQVLLKPHLNKAVEELAEQQGESVSRMTALLVQEALAARGAFDEKPDKSGRTSPEEVRDHIASYRRDPFGLEALTGVEVPVTYNNRQGRNIRHEVTAVDRRWSPSEGQQALEDKTPEWSEPGAPLRAAETKTDDAQMLKLKLMQDLMNQLKEM